MQSMQKALCMHILFPIPVFMYFRFSHGMQVNTNLYGSQICIIKDFWLYVLAPIMKYSTISYVIWPFHCNIKDSNWHSFGFVIVWVDLSHIWTPPFWADYSKFGCVLTSLQWNTVLGGDRAVSHTKSQQTCADSEEIHQISCLVSKHVWGK
jgi:hypothetical protein